MFLSHCVCFVYPFFSTISLDWRISLARAKRSCDIVQQCSSWYFAITVCSVCTLVPPCTWCHKIESVITKHTAQLFNCNSFHHVKHVLGNSMISVISSLWLVKIVFRILKNTETMLKNAYRASTISKYEAVSHEMVPGIIKMGKSAIGSWWAY